MAADIVGGFDAQMTDIDWVPGQLGGSAVESSRGSDAILVDPAPSPAGEDLSLAWWMVDNYDSWQTMMNKYETASTAGNGILLRPTPAEEALCAGVSEAGRLMAVGVLSAAFLRAPTTTESGRT